MQKVDCRHGDTLSGVVIHFQGEAQDFTDNDGTPGRPAWFIGVAVLLVVLTLLGILLGG